MDAAKLPMSVSNGAALYRQLVAGIVAGGAAIGGTVADATAEYPTLQLMTTAAAQDMCEVDVPLDLFGAYGVIIRAKVSAVSSTVPAIKVVASYGSTELKSITIPPSMFSAANTWECMSFGIDFGGTNAEAKKLHLALTSPSGSAAGVTLSVDYIRVVPSGTALGSVG